MKKILIVSTNLNTGGIQKAFVNMLKALEDSYDISILLFYPAGEYLNEVPDKIKLLESNSFLELLGCSQEDAKIKGLFWYVLRALIAIWSRLFNNSIPFKLLMKSMEKISGYDIAISYTHAVNEKNIYSGSNEFVLDRVVADHKVAYIHGDFLISDGNTPHNIKNYKRFDKIIAVSDGTKDSFVRAIPELKHRTYSIRNFNNYNDILDLSNVRTVIYDKTFFNIVTVARLSPEKGIKRCIPLIREIIDMGYNVKWHIIGGGLLENEIKDYINDYALNEDVILYGNQTNPYRYIKNADLFFLPSYHEAAPMVFDEAKSLTVPILSTKTISAKELIVDSCIGWVCENNEDSITSYLVYILEHREELESKKVRLENMNFNNQESTKLFKEIFNF